MRSVSWQQATENHYDVIIVGSGFAGSIMAKQLGNAGKQVLVLEAGEGRPEDFQQHLNHVNTFMQATVKIPNSPFPTSPNAPQPLVTDAAPVKSGYPDTRGYFVQQGPYPFESSYTRRMGGTSLHWFGSCPRMLPEDFKLQSLFGRGVDWPISYDELLPYYDKAELEIGVAAEVSQQKYHGIYFSDDYVYPMHEIPQSYLDKWMMTGLADMPVAGADNGVMIRSIAQARNSTPNADFNRGEGYQPRGAVGDDAIGKRCMGNSSCIPVCPIQARYNALKSLVEAPGDVLNKTVVSRLDIDPESGRISALQCKVWLTNETSEHLDIRLRAKTIVLAANAIENAVLLLASGACNESDQLGRNLMDHPAILSWGLAPEAIGALRGPGLTSTLVNFRGGEFRSERAAFVFEIGNWGWSWPYAEPLDTTTDLIDNQLMYGAALRRKLGAVVPRQIRVDMMTEQLPSADNRVTIDTAWKDQLGNYRPVISYNVDAYSQAGMVFGREFAAEVFQHLKIEDFTEYSTANPGYFDWQGKAYEWAGVGHVAGTHRMGTNRHNSVVDRYQRSWQHDNLYVTGCGSMPTLGTSNPTLTMTALTFVTAEHILRGNTHD